ncbi:hypothetical protein HWV62_21308 [Athelia sp. TMB]|nr:hypothetical protein HWV62_21308 [Athelia sp. TMB]
MVEDNESLTNGGIGGISLQSRVRRRAMDLHTPANQVIFLIQARRAAFLAQSPQLAKERCISVDFERVDVIGPVFRADNSNTHRHMTEFMGLDVEMPIEHAYFVARDIIDGMLKHIFCLLETKNTEQIERVKRQFPHDDSVFPDETLILPFQEGIKLLKESGWIEEDEYEGFSRPVQVGLGQLVKEKFNGDCSYILDKFPTKECAPSALQFLRHFPAWLGDPLWWPVSPLGKGDQERSSLQKSSSVTADQRKQRDDPHTQGNKTVQHKGRAAERDGMMVQMIKGEVSAELGAKVDEHMLAWQREDVQVHTTKLRPCADCQH